MMYDLVHDYLAIPTDYCRRLGDLRWCSSGEAVEQAAADPAIGCTFAMAGEIALFLEGYASAGPLVCFGFVLHLLHLLGMGAPVPSALRSCARLDDLARALRETGRPIRNAGALCARLCRDVPHSTYAPDPVTLGRTLRRAAMIATYQHGLHWPAEVPLLAPAQFEALVRKALERLTPGDVRHWLRHGREPAGRAGETIARLCPADFGEVLAGLGERPRIAGALPLVERLSGALSLPPRRLAHAELPIGGYADITTRGEPEHLLPAQFVLDELEFLRRYSMRELLYYHREEPRAPTAEEEVIVLDQGVRTWGDVRVILAAAALALVQRAGRRAIPWRISTTGAPGRPIAADPDALGNILEASDLSLHPAAALEAALDEPARLPRDIVLLTHPYSLRDPEVSAAAERTPPGTRLFALAVDGGSCAALAELRQGKPVTLSRCRVDLHEPAVDQRATGRSATASPSSRHAWKGDVEPIGFPFRFGIHNAIRDDCFDFDDEGQWLVAAVQHHGPIHAWRLDGTDAQILPRPSLHGRVLARVDSVLGVARGFVVSGSTGNELIAAHYDFGSRTCNAFVLEGVSPPCRWTYLRPLHTIAIDSASGPITLDLGVDRKEAARSLRAAQARVELGSPSLDFLHRNRLRPQSTLMRLDPLSGAVSVHFSPDHKMTCTPQSDGRPALEAGRIVYGRSSPDLVAALVHAPRQDSLVAFTVRPHPSFQCWPLPEKVKSFALDRHGHDAALQFEGRRLEVRALGGGPTPRFVAPVGRCHSTLDVALGRRSLMIKIGSYGHRIHWDGAQLEWSLGSASDSLHRTTDSSMVSATRIPRERSFAGRFTSGCTAYRLSILVDIFGQIVVCNARDDLVCMFLIMREKIAAWLPDGTQVGPVSMIGGPSTPLGLERVGNALRLAQDGRSIP
jgi:hypothetical protein